MIPLNSYDIVIIYPNHDCVYFTLGSWVSAGPIIIGTLL